MPRGPVGGATAALIKALAERGIAVSRYQIERWRASGDLGRPVRHGLGRGRGVRSERPDEQTVALAAILAMQSRRGSRRPRLHPLERFAAGQTVQEDEVRMALTEVLDEVARMTAADLGDSDLGWQQRQAAVDMAAREGVPATWQDLIAAIDGSPSRPEPDHDRARQATAGIVHATSVGAAALGEDLVEAVALYGGLTDGQAEHMRRALQQAELRGEDPWGQVADWMSIRRLREVAEAASFDELHRATAAVMMIFTIQSMIVLLGLLDLADTAVDLPAPINRFGATMVRALQADPMWPLANTVTVTANAQQHVHRLALVSLGILSADTLHMWESYRDRLTQLAYPNQPQP